MRSEEEYVGERVMRVDVEGRRMKGDQRGGRWTV